jgi:hypothetical protein
VKVFRLVTRGTIEELRYLRQVYKTQLTNATIGDVQSGPGSARLFDGVAKDRYRRGELFGMANLLKFEEGTFMNYATKNESKEINKYYAKLKEDMHSVETLRSTLINATEEDKDKILLEEEVVSTLLEEEDVFPNLATRKGIINYLSCFLKIIWTCTNIRFC